MRNQSSWSNTLRFKILGIDWNIGQRCPPLYNAFIPSSLSTPLNLSIQAAHRYATSSPHVSCRQVFGAKSPRQSTIEPVSYGLHLYIPIIDIMPWFA